MLQRSDGLIELVAPLEIGVGGAILGGAPSCKKKNSVIWRLSRSRRGRIILLNTHEAALGRTRRKALVRDYLNAAESKFSTASSPTTLSEAEFLQQLYQFTWEQQQRKKFQYKGVAPKVDPNSDVRLATMLTVSKASTMLEQQGIAVGLSLRSSLAMARFMNDLQTRGSQFRVGFRGRPVFLTRMDSIFAQVIALRNKESIDGPLPPGEKNCSCRMTDLLGVPYASTSDEYILVVLKYTLQQVLERLEPGERKKVRSPTIIDAINNEAFKQGRVDKRLWKDRWGRTLDIDSVTRKSSDGAAEVISPWIPSEFIDRVESFPPRNSRSRFDDEKFLHDLFKFGSSGRRCRSMSGYLLDLYKRVV